jgi:hypothetical protein
LRSYADWHGNIPAGPASGTGGLILNVLIFPSGD